MMNLYKAWEQPLSRLIRDNILVVTPGYRPLGGLVYRFLFWIAKLDALPFRIACFALILFNLTLLYRVASRIAGREVARLSALFACYNASFIDLYYNTGTIYDLLCFTFYFLAFGLYVEIRAQGRYLGRAHLAALLVLYGCALNSKEMAVTLPVVMLVYEIAACGLRGRCSDGVRRSVTARWLPATLITLMTIPFVISKLSSGSPLAGNEYYRLDLAWKTYLSALQRYLELLAYVHPDHASALGVGVLLCALVLAGVVSRRREALFCICFVLVTPLPIAFIPPRGAFVMYIPVFGIATYLALLVVIYRDILVSRFREADKASPFL